MSLLAKIKEDMFIAKKARQSAKSSLLSTLWSESSQVGKNNGNRESTDAETIAVVKKFLNGVEEIIARAPSDVALTLALSEQEILLVYVPKQLTRDELKVIIIAFGTKDKGVIMKTLKEQYAGFYDGKLAAIICGEL